MKFQDELRLRLLTHEEREDRAGSNKKLSRTLGVSRHGGERRAVVRSHQRSAGEFRIPKQNDVMHTKGAK